MPSTFLKPWRVRIFYPADPVGVVPGGVDTFIRGLIQFAPAELEFSLVGMTTDDRARPAGRWSSQEVGDRAFDFFPAVRVADAGKRGRVPLSVRYTAAVARHRARLARDIDAFDFHRLEPSLLYAADRRPKNAFFHQDPAAVDAQGSDMLWRRLPAGYRLMESALATRLSSVWCVRETGVRTLQQRYPALAKAIRFVPTWVDTGVFHPVDAAHRQRLRQASAAALGVPPELLRVISVGRLDSQKNPMLLLESFARLLAYGQRAVLLMVGDGVLRPALERRALELGLANQVRFLGLRSPVQIADLLRSADVYALSSAYEGMPMALLEALACGLPVTTMDVGEVRRVVWPGVNGAVCGEQTAKAFADSLVNVLQNRSRYHLHTTSAIQRYQPARVLAPVYENYLAMAASQAAASTTVVGRLVSLVGVDRSPVELPLPLPPYPGRQRERVIGIPIDVISPAALRDVVMGWAASRESRTVTFCNVHSVVHARRNPVHRAVIEQSDLAAADGAPIAWTLSGKRLQHQPRTSGPDVMLELCKAAQQRGIAVGLYGSLPATLEKLEAALHRRFPGLRVAYSSAPPFRPLSEAEDSQVCAQINAAGVGLLFVALGCPKQEAWMVEHLGRVDAVMLGVGAAFDFHAGTIGRAPAWMQANGLEWLHRMAHSPQRLTGRYAVTNSLFLIRSAAELAAAVSAQGMRVVPGRSAGSGRRNAAAGRSVKRHTKTPSQRLPRTATGKGQKMKRKLDSHHVDELVARVDASLPPTVGRMIQFIAGSAGEGTTTLATAYARALSEKRRRVLLITGKVGRPIADLPVTGVETQSPSQPRRHVDGYNVAKLRPLNDSDHGHRLSHPDTVWAALRASYDTIVVDMPPISASRAGLLIASRCDGVVVVLEAEKSRAPVAHALVSSLRAVRANVLGTVLNKRQYHVPAALYRWL